MAVRMVKSLHSCSAPIERGFLGASRSEWYFDLVIIIIRKTCQGYSWHTKLRENVWETPLTKQLPHQQLFM